MNLQMLRESGRIVFECVGGSHAYGTALPASDRDVRGVFAHPQGAYAGLDDPVSQVGDEKQDVTFYSLKRFFELALTANPNIIELLFMPDDCLITVRPVMERVIANRGLFVSKKCYHTHAGYAHAQIKKARGANKMVHNPAPEAKPVKEDFCWVVADRLGRAGAKEGVAPMRPVPLKETGIDLSDYHASSMEHVGCVFRCYHYGEGSKGVFRGDDMLVCESVPLDEERGRFGFLLVYNKPGYERSLRDWHRYWDWMKNRNEARWVDQEKGRLDYDQKNLLHCMRLLMSGRSILETGRPIVRFEGAQRQYLMDIRLGRFGYDEVMADVERQMAVLEALYKESDAVPHEADRAAVDRLYRELA